MCSSSYATVDPILDTPAKERLNSCTVPDRAGTSAELGIDILDTPYARLVLVVPHRVPKRRIILRAG
jgi:hypothetical protein